MKLTEMLICTTWPVTSRRSQETFTTCTGGRVVSDTSPSCLLRLVLTDPEEAGRGKTDVPGAWALLDLRQKH